MIVMKFGGTSNQDATAMARVVRIVQERAGKHPVIVISAIAQATNDLERAGRLSAAADPEGAMAVLRQLFDRHYAILDALVRNRDRHEEVRAYIASAFDQLCALVRGVAILRELTPRAMDAFCAYGELLSSRLVAAALQEAGARAEWFDTAAFMVTSDDHGAAAPIMDHIADRVCPTIVASSGRGEIPVTQGFIGVTEQGIRTTMGRESSDYSASILGAAVNADVIEIWTDVDGVLTADPRIVPDARRIHTLSFEEAFEVSFFGAKILHPHTMLPAMERSIPVHIYNSRNPSAGGTAIERQDLTSRGGAKSIAFKRAMSRVTVMPATRVRPYLFWEQVLTVLTRYGVPTPLVASSDASIAFAVDSALLGDTAVRDLESLGAVSCQGGLGMITIIGEGLHALADLEARIFSAVKGISVAMVSSGASSRSFSILTAESAVEDATRRLHREFFSEGRSGEE